MNIKSNKLKTAVLASVLALNFGLVNNVYADGIIGQGNYSWDRDWSISLSSNHQTGGGSGSSVAATISYRASTGLLYLNQHRVSESDSGMDTSNNSIVLGDAKTILGGMSEEDILDIVDDAIHNVQGDQTVNGSQDITGDQTVEGEQTVNGGQTVTGGFYFFNNKV